MTKISYKGKTFIGVLMVISIILAGVQILMDGPTAGRTLESFYKDNPEQQERLFDEIVGKENDVVKPSVEIVENDLVMSYTFKKQQSEKKVAELKKRYEDNYKDLNKQGSKMVTVLHEKSKVPAKDITMTLKYYNNDGTLIWEHTYEREY